MADVPSELDDGTNDGECYWCSQPLSSAATEAYRVQLAEWQERRSSADYSDDGRRPFPTCDECLAEIEENRRELEFERAQHGRPVERIGTWVGWLGGLVFVLALATAFLYVIFSWIVEAFRCLGPAHQ